MLLTSAALQGPPRPERFPEKVPGKEPRKVPRKVLHRATKFIDFLDFLVFFKNMYGILRVLIIPKWLINDS